MACRSPATPRPAGERPSGRRARSACWPRRWGAGCPTLGVGHGAQQLVRAAGGDVFRRAELDLGWEPIEFAARDALVRDVDPRPLVFSWRTHTCRLPDDALLLADSAAEPQIFRLGEVAWGVAVPPRGRQATAPGLARQRSGIERRRTPRATRAAARGKQARAPALGDALRSADAELPRRRAGARAVRGSRTRAPRGDRGLPEKGQPQRGVWGCERSHGWYLGGYRAARAYRGWEGLARGRTSLCYHAQRSVNRNPAVLVGIFGLAGRRGTSRASGACRN